MNQIVLLGFSLLLIGCAAPLQSGEMLPKAALYDQLGNSKYSNSLVIGKVSVKNGVGGQFLVTPEGYKEALISSLRQAGLYAKGGNGKYVLDADLVDIDQPIIGFDFTVKATASYLITNNNTGKEMYEQKLTLPCTVLFAEELLADARLRRATGCAVGENITHFLKTVTN